MKRTTRAIIAGILGAALALTFASCSRDTTGTSGESGKSDLKVAIVVNQRFGDNGPMDNLAEGAAKAEKDFGVTIKKMESSSAANYEADVRAMAKDGYNLIFTTFPYMTDATKIISKEYPDTKFGAIFQNINGGSEKFSNVWDTEFHGEGAFYMAGYMAALNTKSNNIGIIIGGEEPSPNAEGNGFMRGAKAANPNITVQTAFVGSYEDPAKAKEIAGAMISSGADYLQCNAGASNAGVIEISKEKGILTSAEITDFYDQYKGYTGIVKIGFGDTLYKGVEAAVKGNFPGGEHGIRDLTNGGYYIDWTTFERFANDNTEHGAKMKEAITKTKEIEKQITDGSLKIEYDTSPPNWERIKNEK